VADSEADGRDVDEYPLLVTVSIMYQGLFDPEPVQVTQISWIVP
jgi:hypothetical protein